MERSIFAFIRKYSARDQIMLLILTLATFPVYFATLELPKRIVNDAIGAQSDLIDIWGYQLTQLQYLMGLCLGFLAAIIVAGLMKMRLNTMKGVVAERLLRRFRFMLLGRVMRFPKPYFRSTSQGELVSMITSEAEPMGGLMGDALAQPVYQGGQMIVILGFLFAQSFWFGLAGVALIPLQAWIIPMLQRQINQLNKARIQQVRALSSEIGETAAGASDLRTNGGVRRRMAMFSARLGKLFQIRFRIYQKKFFMKFINNFITQLTPFFFYSVGGLLAIRGDITIGALVAALAAQKDLASPWKELLAYYNQTQDMAVRWQIVVEKFDPRDIIRAEVFEGDPGRIPHLKGDIVLSDVTVRNADGNTVLEDIDLTIPAGSRVAIKVGTQSERAALAEVLTREVLPARGQVTVAGHALNDLHQAVIASRIGHAHSRPHFFAGTLGDNLMMPLMQRPVGGDESPWEGYSEATRSGNSTDSLDDNWINPVLAELREVDEIREWWFSLVEAMGLDSFMFERMLRSTMNPADNPTLARQVIELRGEVLERLKAKGLDDFVYRFDPEEFNPAMPLGGNLMFAAPRTQISLEELAGERGFLSILMEHGIAEQAIAISQTLIEELNQAFGRDGTQHPLFKSLGIEDYLYEQLVDIAMRRKSKGDEALTELEFTLLLTVPFAFSAEQIGPAFPESFKREIVNIRRRSGASIRARAESMFIPIDPANYLPRLSILENLLYGRISMIAGNKAEEIEEIVSELLAERGLRRRVAQTIFGIDTGLSGGNLPGIMQERVAFARAGIKRPDVLILDQALASHNADQRRKTNEALRRLMPNSTLIFMEDDFQNPERYDLYMEIRNGRIEGVQRKEREDDDEEGSDDLRRKLKVITSTELFHDIDMRNQRLLAFAAQWYEVKAGQSVFEMGDKADAAYLCVSGQAKLVYLDDDGGERFSTSVEPGRLIGDLQIILDEPRQLSLIAVQPSKFLRIGAKEFKAVLENDTQVLMSLLKSVSSNLVGVADYLRDTDFRAPEHAGPPAPPLE